MSNLRPSTDSRPSETLLEPHRAPELGTSLSPTEPPEGGEVVAGGRVVVVVFGAGLVVVVAGLVVGGVVVGEVLAQVPSVDPGSWSYGSAASLPNPSMEASDEPIRQSQAPWDSA